MTAAEICAAARAWAPCVQLRDVWFLMRQMTGRGLATTLNERSNNGRLYALTEAGRRAAVAAFGTPIVPVPADLDWRLYAWVVRARIRKRVLLGLVQIEVRHPEGQTGSSIRKHIRQDYPVGLNPVLRAVRELESRKLITCVGVTRLRSCKLYRVTPAGLAVTRELER